jgi:hypothetical protein
MCLLWRVHPDARHVRMLGPLVGFAGGPSLRALAVVWSRRICKLPSKLGGMPEFGGCLQSLKAEFLAIRVAADDRAVLLVHPVMRTLCRADTPMIAEVIGLQKDIQHSVSSIPEPAPSSLPTPDRPPNMSVVHRQPRRSLPAGPRARSLSALQMARSCSIHAVCEMRS